MTIRERVCDLIPDDEELLFMDGFDECIVGVIEHHGEFCVVYSIQEILSTLMGQGMSIEEAQEFFEYNQRGAYMGPKTPLFMDTFR